MSDFDIAVRYVINNEGGVGKIENDTGGLTNSGISLTLLKNIPADRLKTYGIFDAPSEETIHRLTPAEINSIYFGEFWVHAPFQSIIDQEMGNYIFDTCVNFGISPGVKCLQRACWSYSRNRKVCFDDGIFGNQTLRIVNGAGKSLFSALRSERAAEYRLIVSSCPDKKNSLNGWLNRAYEK